MCKQKFKLSLLFFIFLTFFLFSQGRTEPLSLLCSFVVVVSSLGVWIYLEHRSPLFQTIRPLSWGCLTLSVIFLVFPFVSYCIILPAFLIFYGALYILLLLINRFLLARQKVPGTFALVGMGTLLVIAGVCSWLLCLCVQHSLLWDVIWIFLIPLTIGLYGFLWKPDTLDGKGLPLLFSSFLPYFIMKSHSPFEKESRFPEPPDVELFIHVADTKYGKLGHTDLYFDHQVISFGGYDASSQKLDGMFGEGMIFFAPDKEKYLKFCRSYSKKTIFSFGIRLSEEQKQQLRINIQSVKQQTEPWNPPADFSSEYASCLQQATGATFYKFTHGPWKTYFILRNNCTFFCNFLLRFLKLAPAHRIVTPGFYYARLLHGWKRGDPFLVSKEIYPYKGERKWDTTSYTIPEKQ